MSSVISTLAGLKKNVLCKYYTSARPCAANARSLPYITPGGLSPLGNWLHSPYTWNHTCMTLSRNEQVIYQNSLEIGKSTMLYTSKFIGNWKMKMYESMMVPMDDYKF